MRTFYKVTTLLVLGALVLGSGCTGKKNKNKNGLGQEGSVVPEFLDGDGLPLTSDPFDQTHQRLIGHVLWPDAADTPKAGTVAPTAGTRGRAWPLAARWSAMLPADGGWRQWRLRQWVDAAGTWQVAASQPDRHTPRLVLEGGA